MIAAAPRNVIETDLAAYQRCCLHHYSHMTAGVALPAIAILAAVALVVALLHRNQVTRAFKAETALRASREVLSLAMRGGGMGAWSRDVVTNKVWWSPELEEIFGLPAGGLEGSDAAFFAYVHENDRPAVAHAIETTLATGNDYVIEFRIRDATGEWRWIEGRGKPSYGEDGRIVTLHGVCIDITAHKAVEQSLRQSEERYHTLFESIDEGFCIIEVIFDAARKPVDYRFVEVNPAFVGHTGLTDALGKTMRALVPDHDAHWFETYGRVATSGKAERFVNEAKALGRWFDVYAAQTGPAGSNRVAVLFNDITARKQAEKNLQALAADLAGFSRCSHTNCVIRWRQFETPSRSCICTAACLKNSATLWEWSIVRSDISRAWSMICSRFRASQVEKWNCANTRLRWRPRFTTRSSQCSR